MPSHQELRGASLSEWNYHGRHKLRCRQTPDASFRTIARPYRLRPTFDQINRHLSWSTIELNAKTIGLTSLSIVSKYGL